jgi:hypothetical protein
MMRSRTILLLIGAGLFVIALSLITLSFAGRKSVPNFVARDPNSPTVVEVSGIKPLFGPISWGCTISVDGFRPTQHCGWPKGEVADNVEPTAAAWHSNPDWVEIVLSSGEKLKLTWNTLAVEEARKSSERHFYLNPKYELLSKPQ